MTLYESQCVLVCFKVISLSALVNKIKTGKRGGGLHSVFFPLLTALQTKIGKNSQRWCLLLFLLKAELDNL